MEQGIPAPPPEKVQADEDYAKWVRVVVKFTVAGKDLVMLFVGKTLGYTNQLIGKVFGAVSEFSIYSYLARCSGVCKLNAGGGAVLVHCPHQTAPLRP